jgi:DNA repair ATPase RecN
MQTEHKQQEDYTNALSSQVMNLIDELNQSLNNDPSNKPLIQKYQEAKIDLQKANDSLRLRHEQVQFNNTVIKRQQAQLEVM